MQTYNTLSSSEEEELAESMDMDASVRAVEELLKYPFTNKKLLEEALTHSSYTESANYQRLEFLGDAALGLAISNYMFSAYPEVDQHQLTDLRSFNVSTEKLARVAVRHGLYRYIRRKTAALDEQVKDFTMMVQQEDDLEVYGGEIGAPKVLADIVESVAGAVYTDCGLDLERLWMIFRGLLEPIVTLDVLQQQPQPISLLSDFCKKEGKELNIKHRREGEETIASVYIDGEFIVSSSSNQKDNARLQAAKAALQKLSYKISDKMSIDLELDENNEIQGAKQKLNELCCRKKWPKPSYRIDKQNGPAHDRRFICSVEIPTVAGVPLMTGDEKARVKDAENSAASIMLRGLQESNFI